MVIGLTLFDIFAVIPFLVGEPEKTLLQEFTGPFRSKRDGGKQNVLVALRQSVGPPQRYARDRA